MGHSGPDRRGSPEPDTGDRRRADDDLVEKLAKWMEMHDDWARDLAARLDQRLKSVEDRADLLDGRKIGGGGILGTLGKMDGSVEEIGKRQERQAKALEAIRRDVRDVKAKTGAQDGQKPPTRLERIITILGPILIVLITTLGGIIVAYLALRGQLAGLQSGGGK